MNTDPPATQLRDRLRPEWRALCEQLHVTDADDRAFDRLADAYEEPVRTYHNLAHIDDCLTIFDPLREQAGDPALVAAAIWFHDVIYEIGATDNESRSAGLAVEQLGGMGLADERCQIVAALIEATAHREPPGSADAAFLCDIDLSILGRDQKTYEGYAEAIFAEVRVPWEVFVPHRVRFLETMLARPAIFHTETGRIRWEAQARTNMAAERNRLSAP